MTHKSHKLTTISVSYENYLALKKLGTAGDSFNDVLTWLLQEKEIQQQTDPQLGRLGSCQAHENCVGK